MEKSSNIAWVVALVAVLVVAFVVWQGKQAPPSGDGTVLRDTITVTGTAELKVEPDKADIWVLVESKAATAEAAQSALKDTSNALIDALKEAGVLEKDIETTSFSVYPDYKWDPDTGESKLIGYRGQHSIKVIVHELDQVGEIIDTASQAGGLVQNVQYALTDEARKRYDDDALKLAASDARQKAESLTSSVGARLGKVVAIQESNVYYPPWPVYARGAYAEDVEFAKATEILPGPVSVSAQVSVTYELG